MKLGIIGIAVLFVGVLIVYQSGLFEKPYPATEIQERWETANSQFKIRVTAYPEKNGGFVPGAYYSFQTSRTGLGEWHEIMTIRHDDPVPIPRGQVRFVNELIAYAFMSYRYAVTTDGGLTWTVVNLVTDLPGWRINRPSIIDAIIKPDGTGVMNLSSATNQTEPQLLTTNYGREWK